MPSFLDVAKHFDDIPILDGYTSALQYYGQFSTFLESSADGSTSQRRTLSLAPDLAIPARGVVSVLGETWIVGYGTVDGFYGQAVRKSYWTKRATGLFTVLTPGQAALGASGTLAYGHKDYLKDTVDGVSNSAYDPFWDLYFSTSELISKGTFLELNGTLYRVRSTHVGPDGTLDAASDELDAGARVAVVFDGLGAYDPVTDTMAAGSVDTTAILLDRYKMYDKKTQADANNMAGDMTLVVSELALTPVAGKSVKIDNVNWRIQNVVKEQDAYSLHIRRA